MVCCYFYPAWVFSSDLVVKNPPANARDAGNSSLIPELERSPGVGNGNLLQYSCLEKIHSPKHLMSFSLKGHKDSDITK